jgi:hypothetical protein
MSNNKLLSIYASTQLVLDPNIVMSLSFFEIVGPSAWFSRFYVDKITNILYFSITTLNIFIFLILIAISGKGIDDTQTVCYRSWI